MKGGRYLAIFIRDFFIILGFTTASASLFLFIFSIRSVDVSLLWQFALISLGVSLLNYLYYSEGIFGRLPMIIKTLVHFTLNLVLYFSSAYLFKWFSSAGTAFILMFLLFMSVGYVLCFIVIYTSECLLARKLNEKLGEYKSRRSEKIE